MTSTFCNELTGPDVEIKVNSGQTGYIEDNIDEEIDTDNYEGGLTDAAIEKK